MECDFIEEWESNSKKLDSLCSDNLRKQQEKIFWAITLYCLRCLFLLSAVSSLCKDAKFGRMTQKILIWDAKWRPPGCVFQQTHPSWGLTFPTPFPPDEPWWKTMSQFWNNPLENRGDFQKMTVRPSELDPCYRSQTHMLSTWFSEFDRESSSEVACSELLYT